MISSAFKTDAKKVLQKISGKRPGKPCGKSFVSAEKRCKSHYTDGKLNATGKSAAEVLAAKIRSRKGMPPKSKVEPEMTVAEKRAMLRKRFGALGSGSRIEQLAKQEERRAQIASGDFGTRSQVSHLRQMEREGKISYSSESNDHKPRTSNSSSAKIERHLAKISKNFDALSAPGKYAAIAEVIEFYSGKPGSQKWSKPDAAILEPISPKTIRMSEQESISLARRLLSGDKIIDYPSLEGLSKEGRMGLAGNLLKLRAYEYRQKEERRQGGIMGITPEVIADEKVFDQMREKGWSAHRTGDFSDADKDALIKSLVSRLSPLDKSNDPIPKDAKLRLSPNKGQVVRGRNIDSTDNADNLRNDGDTGKYKICGRGWQGIKGNCKRVAKGTGAANSRKASAVELADQVRAARGLKSIDRFQTPKAQQKAKKDLVRLAQEKLNSTVGEGSEAKRNVTRQAKERGRTQSAITRSEADTPDQKQKRKEAEEQRRFEQGLDKVLSKSKSKENSQNSLNLKELFEKAEEIGSKYSEPKQESKPKTGVDVYKEARKSGKSHAEAKAAAQAHDKAKLTSKSTSGKGFGR